MPTACTTAQNAARHVTFRWQTTNVPNHAHSIHFQMDPDDRLAAAAGGAVRCMADSAGLSNDAILQLQTAVLAACKKCFLTQKTGKHCEINLRRTEDRIEVEVLLPECKPPDDESGLSLEGIDDVHCEARGESGVLRLTKFIATAADAD